MSARSRANYCRVRSMLAIAACVLCGACASDDPSSDTKASTRRANTDDKPSTRGDKTDDELSGLGELDDPEASAQSSGGFEQPGGTPSGAEFRVVNLYTPLNGKPGPVEIYGLAWATEADKPLITVPYAKVSEPFDPKVFGDNGDAFLSVYWSGTSGDGNALISVTATLKRGDRFTYVLTTGSVLQESGRRFGMIEAFDHRDHSAPFDADVDTAGKALLVVSSAGLEQVLDEPSKMRLFFSLGNGCTKAITDEDFSLTSVGPGTAGTYLLDPGSYTAAIHAYPEDFTGELTCDNKPILDGIAIDVEADQTAVLKIYAPEDGPLRTLFVPLED